MQMLTIAGTIGRDAEVRRTQSGDAVAGFSVAVDNGKDKDGNRRDATWFDCSLWGKRGDALAPYLTKGTRVCITGRPGAREHNGKVYLQCNVDELSLLGGGTREQRADPRPAPADNIDDDEIPF